MIIIKNDEQIELIKRSGLLLGKAHGEVAKIIKPGVQTAQLDKVAEEFIRDNGGVPSFKGYNSFPSSLCISVNSAVVHGFPGKYELKEGDIVSVDCGVFLNGYHADSAYTYPIGEVSQEVKKLLKVTKESLFKGLDEAKAGNRMGDVGYAIQTYVEKEGFSVVRELVGHGIGKSLHEAPEVPNYGRKGQGLKLQEGTVLAVEPMVNLGRKAIVQEADGWTIRTRDNLPSAHFEHTIVVRKGAAEILTTFEFIEQVINKHG
ncbi:MAG: type I methionyl aminopeptidase [Pedobacter sp.]|nr:MAG: type I methionyl aminopeptidase [Pedobacter sp.]